MARGACLVVLALGCSLTSALEHGSGLTTAGRIRQQSLEAAWSRELTTSSGPSPVQRVVSLLKKMKAELEKEAENESEMYDKMVCWCESNEKEKTAAIAAAEARDLDLTSEVGSRGARFGELSTEIASTKQQITDDNEALEKATKIQEKSAAEFREEEQDLVQAITNLKNAIAVLSRHHGESLLQSDEALMSGMRVVLRNTAIKYQMLVAGSKRSARPLQSSFLAINKETSSVDRALLNALDIAGSEVSQALDITFAQEVVERTARAGAFLQTRDHQPIDAAYKSYSARSGNIYGIMNTMLEEFEAKLSTAQKDNTKTTGDFKALQTAKTSQIATSKEKLDDLEGDHAANQKALSDAKEDLELTRKQRTADVKFLRNLKLTCNDLDKEWEKRSATRAAETTAVAETIVVLTEDDNREMLAKSVSLLQENKISKSSASVAAARRSHAADTLRRAAQAPNFDADDLLADWHAQTGAVTKRGVTEGPRSRLSTLAVAVQLDSFTKVKEMMDSMVADLKAEQEEEVKFKAYCTKEFNGNEKATFQKNEVKEDLEAKMNSLSALMEKLSKEIAEAKKQISAVSTEVKKASQAREAQNSEFQTTVADQRATQSILNKALLRLKDFYTKGIGKKVLLQAGQTPPVKFNSYKTNAGASPVMGLIEQIIEDSKKLEAEATATEYQAQADYEKFVKDSNDMIAQLSEAVTTKTKNKAAAGQDAAEAQSDHDSTMAELESLAAYEGDLHGQCDFVLKNFEVRQKARLQEMEAIQSAKAILSGEGEN